MPSDLGLAGTENTEETEVTPVMIEEGVEASPLVVLVAKLILERQIDSQGSKTGKLT